MLKLVTSHHLSSPLSVEAVVPDHSLDLITTNGLPPDMLHDLFPEPCLAAKRESGAFLSGF